MHFYRLLLVLIAAAAPTLVQAQAADVVGSVTSLQGQADLVRDGQPPASIAVSDDVQRQDELITRAASALEVSFSDGSQISLDENSRVTIAQYAPASGGRSLLQLARGRLRNSVSTTFSNQPDAYQVETREGVMGVQGTQFDVLALARETLLYVYEGVVSAVSRDPGFPQVRTVRAGEFVRIRLGEAIAPPVRFADADKVRELGIGSGGLQDLQSGGDQSSDPLTATPDAPDRRSDDSTQVPPRPNPPSQK